MTKYPTGEKTTLAYSSVAKVFVIAAERAATEHSMNIKNSGFTTTTQ
jgi:hypothetical protein